MASPQPNKVGVGGGGVDLVKLTGGALTGGTPSVRVPYNEKKMVGLFFIELGESDLLRYNIFCYECMRTISMGSNK